MLNLPGSTAGLILLAETFLEHNRPMPVDMTARLLEAGIDVSALTDPAPEPLPYEDDLVPAWLAALSNS